eukprot:SAG25_NODE_872_length_4992_cov_3.716183_6_plen_107_part_00
MADLWVGRCGAGRAQVVSFSEDASAEVLRLRALLREREQVRGIAGYQRPPPPPPPPAPPPPPSPVRLSAQLCSRPPLRPCQPPSQRHRRLMALAAAAAATFAATAA